MSPHSSRRRFLQLLAGSAALPAQSAPPPNIVFIMADDLGYGDLGCFGQKIIQTPNIDRLAAEGIRFTDAYAGCTVCAPSRSVLMTGKHMGHTSVRANTGGVPLLAEDVTVAEVLKQAGYMTGAFGKWGIGDIGSDGVPWKQGFDTYYGYLHQIHAHNQYPGFLFSNDDVRPFPQNLGGYKEIYGNDLIARMATGFLREAGSKKKPFFLYLALTLPHFFAGPLILRSTNYLMSAPNFARFALRDLQNIRAVPIPFRMKKLSVKLLWHERMHRDPGHQWMRATIADLLPRSVANLSK